MQRPLYEPPKGTHRLRRGRFSGQNLIYHITTRTYHRRKVFENFMAGRAVVNALRRAHMLGHADTLAFVVMPDHLHWLMQLTGNKPLSVTINTVKSLSARGINLGTGRRGPIWQKGFFDRGLRRDEDVVSVARYIIANPIRASIVEKVADYPLWDAIWI